MKILDLTMPTPAENLACEEVLLNNAEAGVSGEVLRFWESPTHFVVVGYANKVATEVNVAACETQGIPILRRCSGGGTVVQGPGCLNYALVLRIAAGGPTHSIHSANEFIMARNRNAIASLGRGSGFTLADLRVQGHTDLTINGRKFSGNAQRRRKDFLLFHGTFLLNFDLSVISQLLQPPSKQPNYRESRPHKQFIMNLGVTSLTVKQALIAEWQATTILTDTPHFTTALLEKYQSAEWNRKL